MTHLYSTFISKKFLVTRDSGSQAQGGHNVSDFITIFLTYFFQRRLTWLRRWIVLNDYDFMLSNALCVSALPRTKIRDAEHSGP